MACRLVAVSSKDPAATPLATSMPRKMYVSFLFDNFSGGGFTALADYTD